MMSIGSVASVAVMARFILREMLIEPQMAMIDHQRPGRHWLAAWLGLTFGAHLRRDKDERKLQSSNTPIVGT